MFFVIEEPMPDWTMDVKGYMKDLLSHQSERLWDRLEANSFRPYDRSRAYEIARRLDVMPRQFPCVVFFSDLDSKRSLVVELRPFAQTQDGAATDYTEAFRTLFSLANAAASARPEKRLDDLARMLTAEKWKRRLQSTAGGIRLSDVGKSFMEVITTLIK
jgi:hypothetical protein